MFVFIFIGLFSIGSPVSKYVSAATLPNTSQNSSAVQEDNIFNEKVVDGVFVNESTTEETNRKSRKHVSSVMDIVNCGMDMACFIDTAETVLEERRQLLLAEADAKYWRSNEARGVSSESPSELVKIVQDIIAEMGDIISSSVSGWFRQGKGDETKAEEDNIVDEENDDDQDEDEADEEEEKNKNLQEEGRGKKKKKKLKTLIKFLIFGAVLKAKITLLLHLLSVALQVKFLLIAFAGLLLAKIRLWYELKKGHQPQKVIYYEHAQHQHHYDHPEEEHGFWGRAYDVSPDEQEKRHDIVYKGQRPIPWSS